MKIILAALAATCAIASPASAGVLVNGMPTGTLYSGGFTNNSTDQNFLVRFTLGTAATVDGFEILSGLGYAALGDPLRIKIRSDVNGAPAATNLYSFTDTIDDLSLYQNNLYRVRTDFGPIALAAGSYWFGVSGENDTQVWAAFNNGGPMSPTYQRQLLGDTIRGQANIYDLAYNVLGTPAAATAAVPEPATWAMMIAGFGLVGGTMRRRSAKVAFA